MSGEQYEARTGPHYVFELGKTNSQTNPFRKVKQNDDALGVIRHMKYDYFDEYFPYTFPFALG